jgi:2Fe-2S ferredoxin
MPKISVPQKQMTLDVADSVNLMTVLIESGLPVASSCLGEGVCSMCRVKIEGSVAPAERIEVDCLRRNNAEPNERLSCQIKVTSDIVVTTRYW